MLWNKAIINGGVFAHAVYTKTSEAVKTLDHKFEKYLKFVAKTRNIFNAIIKIPNNNFSKFIGIVICWIILAIKNPFLEITQWLR